MTAQIIDGEAVASRIREEIAEAVVGMEREHGVRPGLATVIVGNDPASAQYVRMKRNRCKKVGIDSFGRELEADTTQERVEGLVRELGATSR